MAGEAFRFQRAAKEGDYLRSLESPANKEWMDEQDVRPENVASLQQAIADRRHQSPMQQQMLGDELKRIQALQTQRLQQAAQAMPQQLQKSLSPASLGEWPSREAMIVRMMLQMQRRHRGMQNGPTPQVPF